MYLYKETTEKHMDKSNLPNLFFLPFGWSDNSIFYPWTKYVIISQTHEYFSQIVLNTILGKNKFFRSSHIEWHFAGGKNPHFMYAIKWHRKIYTTYTQDLCCFDLLTEVY